MSVYHQTLVLYGWEIGTDTYSEYDPDPEDDWYENEIAAEYGWIDRSEGEVACVYDGRGGRYCYFGVVVAATNDTGDGPQSFDKPVTLSSGQALTQEQAVALGEAVESLGLDVDTEEMKYHVFTHVT